MVCLVGSLSKRISVHGSCPTCRVFPRHIPEVGENGGQLIELSIGGLLGLRPVDFFQRLHIIVGHGFVVGRLAQNPRRRRRACISRPAKTGSQPQQVPSRFLGFASLARLRVERGRIVARVLFIHEIRIVPVLFARITRLSPVFTISSGCGCSG